MYTVAARHLLSLNRKVECNICGWQGYRFLNNEWHKHTVCPACGSLVRHRMIMAACETLGEPFDTTLRACSVLHFAPEKGLSASIRRNCAKYRTADLNRSDVDLRVDMSQMRTIPDGAFDTVIACDVLEHIPDDMAALAEIHRILSKGGVAILTVPQKDGLLTTFSDPTLSDPAEREAAFGHHDHLRIYGSDFPDLLTSSGFEVHQVFSDSFARASVERLVLRPPFPSRRPLATNQQIIFFAVKPA